MTKILIFPSFRITKTIKEIKVEVKMLTIYRGLQLQLKQLKIIFIFLCYEIESILYFHLTTL